MRTLPLAMALLLIPAAAAPQSLVQTPPGSALSLELLHASFDDDDDVAFYSGAYFLGGRFELRPGLALIAELPFAHFNYDPDGEFIDGESSSTVGNPLIGLALQTGRAELIFAGRAPLASDDEGASLYGALTDQYRMEAFFPDMASLQAAARLSHMASDVTRLGFDLGSVLFIPTEGGDIELALDYGGSATYLAEVFRVGAGLNGRAFVTSGADDIGGLTEHQAALFADFGRGQLRPGLSLRIPLDESTRDFVNMTFGFTLQYLLP